MGIVFLASTIKSNCKYTVSTEKTAPQTMYDRNVKSDSECILTKLCALDYEYICDRIAKFHKKILFITRVIDIQILMTKYFSFQCSVTYCSQALRQDNAPAHRAVETVHLLTHETPDFIIPTRWPLASQQS